MTEKQTFRLLVVMDMSEDLLFQHISIVLKLLNSFTDKNNLTSPHILRRLDYLYERLSDFLGRDLDNDWWSDNSQVESQLTYFKSPKHLIARTPSSSRAESIDFQPPQSFETAESRLIPLNFDSVGTTDSSSVSVVNFCLSQNNITESTSSIFNIETTAAQPELQNNITESTSSTSNIETTAAQSELQNNITESTSTSNKETTAAQPELQKNDMISSKVAQSTSMEAFNNCELAQDVRITETKTYAESINVEPMRNTEIIENVSPIESTVCAVDKITDVGYKCTECNEEITLLNCDQALSLALHVQSTMHQQAMTQKTEKSAVNITAKTYVTEK